MIKITVVWGMALFLCIGCHPASTAAKKSAAPDSYSRANEMAARAFEELDCLETGGNECIPSGSAANAPSDSYSRGNQMADEAFRDLDCTLTGACERSGETAFAPSPDIPEEPARPEIQEKARPGAVVEAAISRSGTKYPIVNGYPVWFSQPWYDGYAGGVGVAKAQRGGYATQRRVAVMLAQADLARSVEVNVYAESTSERELTDSRVSDTYREKFSTMSRQEAREYLESPRVMDEWTDETTGDLYIWVILPK